LENARSNVENVRKLHQNLHEHEKIEKIVKVL
jgi:hypothetical protein